MKLLKHLRFVLKKIYQSEFAKIINENDIEFIIPKRITGMSPYIKKH